MVKGTVSTLALAVAATMAAMPVSAQIAPAAGADPQTAIQPDAQPAPADDIVVTGSLVRVPGLQAISPVATIGEETLALDRSLTVENTLGRLPQFAGSFGASSNGNDARGAATADLRGLGQNRTLVLIDGKRGAPFGFRNSVDLNSIPVALIERVDVLTGGAAADYGADAVAGVVNFITKRNFTGLEANATSNFSERGEGLIRGVSVAYGQDLGGRGNIAGFIGYSERDPILKAQRSFASPEFSDTGPSTGRPLGGYFRRSDSAAVFNLSSIGGPAAGNTFGFNDDNSLSPTATSSILAGRESLVIGLKRLNADVFFHYDVTDGVELYGRGMYTRTEATDSLPPANTATTVLVQRTNPYLTTQLRSILANSYNRTADGTLGGTDAVLLTVTRSLGELGNRVTVTDRDIGQGQLGLRGQAGRLHWDAYAQYGISDESSPIYGEGVRTRFQQAANATTVNGQPACYDPSGGCVPANIFGVNAISAPAADYIGAVVDQGRRREQFVTGLTLSADSGGFLTMPGGPIAVVVGAEYRDERANITYGDIATTGQTFNQGTRNSFKGGFNVKDLFGEVRVPLLKDVPFFQALNVEAAYRYSDYSSSGGVDAWKVGGDWSPVRDLRIRGSYQRVVRAPNIGELFGPTSSISLVGRANDPCANPTASGASVQTCTASGAPAGGYTQDLTGALFLYGGRSTIQPETGKTWTAGAVLTPSFIPGLSLTADYYDITIDNAVGAVLPQATLDTCFVIARDINNLFCQQVARQANGQLASVNSSDINVATLQSRGVDVVGNYRFNLAATRVGLSYAGSYVISQKQQNGVTAPIVECAGRFGATCGLETRRALPQYRHRADLTLGGGPVTLRGTWRLEGPVRDDAAATVYKVERIGTQNYVDLALSFDVSRRATFVIGVDNLFDRQPPLAFSNAADANTFPQSYDVIGRRFGVSFTFRN
jgi:iron complex outermembrane recepter protein